MLSAGDEYLQLDAGYRDQWLSPLTDSSMLISTEAPTMPSLTVSNQEPIGGSGSRVRAVPRAHELYQPDRCGDGGYTAGYPELAGMHLGIEPVDRLGDSRATRPGSSAAAPGRSRSASCSGHLFSRTLPSGSDAQYRLAVCQSRVSITSAYTFRHRSRSRRTWNTPRVTRCTASRYRFHETSLSAGVHFPELFNRFDLTLEASEWQNSWYTDYVWLEGMTENGYVIGNWGADWRTFGDAVGAQTQYGAARLAARIRAIRSTCAFGLLQNAGLRRRMRGLRPTSSYRRAEHADAEYAQPRNGYTRGLELDAGRDVFGKGFGGSQPSCASTAAIRSTCRSSR